MHSRGFSSEEIITLLQSHYGLQANVQPLSGYEEENYLVAGVDGSKFILKVAACGDEPESLHGQTAMLDYLSESKMAGCFPEVIAVKGDPESAHQKILRVEKGGQAYAVRLLSFLEGRFWHEAESRPPRLFESLGDFLGRFDKELAGFSHCGLRRTITWDVRNAAAAAGELHYIKEPSRRRLADYFLLQFEVEALPHLANLRQAYIHNDANDYNILLDEDTVAGLIDFGDAVYTNLINNLAVACTYAILYESDPLQTAALIVRGYHHAYPLQHEETDLLYYLIAARLCISVTQSAKNTAKDSTNEHHFLSETAAWNLLEKWIRINPLRAKEIFRRYCDFESRLAGAGDYTDLLAERKKHIGRNLSISYEQPLKIVQGALQYLYDDQGNTYIDCVNNVSHVGHCHPVVVRAMQKQIARLNTNTRYLHDSIVQYAAALTATLPDHLSVCYFVNSGSEANDLAIRMARQYTSRQDVIVLDHAYHGTSTLAIEMSPYKFDSKGGGGQKPYVHKAVFPDLYRGSYRYGTPRAAEKYADSVAEILSRLQEHGSPAAAFICETVPGVGGQIPLPPGYLRTVYEHVRKYGAVCIADEVQVGFGRVGKAFWGFQLQHVVPDIVVMGKPMGNGHPLAAVVVSEAIAQAFDNGLEYFNTFGGNPVSMVAGQTVLRVIREERMQEHALSVGNFLIERLTGLMERFSIIGDVRGHGLFIGVELVKSRQTMEPAVPEIDHLVEEMKRRGFLLSTDGPLHNVLKIKPPMTFDHGNATSLILHLEEVFSVMQASGPG